MILLLLNNKGFEESKSVYFCLLVFYTIKVNNLQNVFNINDLIRNSKLLIIYFECRINVKPKNLELI